MASTLTKTLCLLLILISLSAKAQCPAFFGIMGGSDYTVCPGATVNMELSPSAWDPSGGTITYQWYYKNGTTTSCPSGNSTTGWTPIVSSNNYQLSISVSQSRSFACYVMPSNGNCTSQWASGCRKVTVLDTSNSYFGRIDTLTQVICVGGDPMTVDVDSLPYFPTGSTQYQWYYKDGLWPAPTGSTAGWTLIQWANTDHYTPPSGLSVNRTYACVAIGCPGTKWINGCQRVKVIAPSQVNWGTADTQPDTFCNNETPPPIELITQPSGPTLFNYSIHRVYNGCDPSTSNILEGYATTVPSYQPQYPLSYGITISSPGCGSGVSYCFIRDAVEPIPYFGTLRNLLYKNICTTHPEERHLGFDQPVGAYHNYYMNNTIDRIHSFQWYYKTGFVDAPEMNDPTTGWILIPNATDSTYDAPPGINVGYRTYACYVSTPQVTNCPSPITGWAENVYWVGDGNTNVLGTIAPVTEILCSPNMTPVTFSELPQGFPITPVPYPYLNNDFSTNVTWFSKPGNIGCPTGNSVGSWNPYGNVYPDEEPVYTLRPNEYVNNLTIAAWVIPADTVNCQAGWASGCRHITLTNPITNPGVLNYYNLSICPGDDPPPITFSTLPSGGSGNYEYQWCFIDGTSIGPLSTFYAQFTSLNVSGAITTLIPGANSPSYDPPAGIPSRTYFCLVRDVSSGCGFYAQPGLVKIYSNTYSYGKITSENLDFIYIYVCPNDDPDPISLIELPGGFPNGFTYQWYFKPGNGTIIPSTPLTDFTPVPGQNSATLDLPNGGSEGIYGCYIIPTVGTGCYNAPVTGGWATGTVKARTPTTINYGTINLGTRYLCQNSVVPAINFSTAPFVNGGSNLPFPRQWYYKDGVATAPTGNSTTGWTLIPGATGTSYTPPMPPAARTYACYVTQPVEFSNCFQPAWATGALTIDFAPNPITNSGALSPSSETLCSGSTPSPIDILTSPTLTSGTVNYNWYKKQGLVAAPTGNSTTGWTLISTTTTGTLAIADTIQQSYTYACYITTTGTVICTDGQWMQGCKQVTIQGTPLNNGTIHSLNMMVCQSSLPPTFYFDTIPYGNNITAFNYQWQYCNLPDDFDYVNATYGNIGSVTWNNITGATSATYQLPAGSVTSGRAYICKVQPVSIAGCFNYQMSAGCNFLQPMPDNSIAQGSLPTIVSGNQVICQGGDPNLIVFTSSQVPQTNYQWYYTDAIATCPTANNTVGWTMYTGVGGNTVSIDPPAGLATDRTYACLTITDSCSTPRWVNSCRKVAVSTPDQSSYGTIQFGDQDFCTASGIPAPISFSTLPSDATSYNYAWYYQTGIVPAPTGGSTAGWTLITSGTSATYTATVAITTNRTYACFVTPSGPSGCSFAAAWANGCRHVTVNTPNPLVYYGRVASDTVLTCNGTTSIGFANPPYGGSGTFTYQWYRKEGVVATPTGTSTAGWTYYGNSSVPFSPTNPSTYTYACFVSATGCVTNGQWAEGSVVLINGNSQITSGIFPTTTETLPYCQYPSSITFTTLPQAIGGDIRVKYYWYQRGSLVSQPVNSADTTLWILRSVTDTGYYLPQGYNINHTNACYIKYYNTSTSCTSGAWATGIQKITITNTSPNYGVVNSTTETICLGADPSPIDFSTLPSNFSNGYTVQWYKSSAASFCLSNTDDPDGWTLIPGATSITYDPPPIGISTRFTCRVIPNQPLTGCTTSQPRFSGCKLVTVLQPATTFSPGVSQSGSQTICPGENPNSITQSNLTSGPSFTFTFQWYTRDIALGLPYDSISPVAGGWTIIPGATGTSYDPPAGQMTSLVYACYVTGTSICGGPTKYRWMGNPRFVTVSPASINFGTINSVTANICPGGDPSSISFTTAPSGYGTGTISYQWYYQDSEVTCPTGSDVTGWNLISGATGATHNPPAPLNNTRTYACFVTISNTLCSPAGQWASGCKVVNANLVWDYGTITSPTQYLCTGGDPAAIPFSQNPTTGYTSSQWYYKDGVNACPTGNSTTGWTIINGAFGMSYNPPTGLATSRTYACFVATSTACNGPSQWATGCGQVIVNTDPPSFGNLVTTPQNICAGAAGSPITFATPPSGGSGVYTYQWYYQLGSVACPSGSSVTGWTIISGATSATYTPVSSYPVATFACRVTSTASSCSPTIGWATGCVIVTNAQNFSAGTISSTAQTICYGNSPGPITFSSQPSGTNLTYTWYMLSSSDACPTGNFSYSTADLLGTTTVPTIDPVIGITTPKKYTCYITVAGTDYCPTKNVWAGSCQSSTISGTALGLGVSNNGESICIGGDPSVITTSASGGLGTLTYDWYYKDGIVYGPDVADTTTQNWIYITTTSTASYDPPAGLQNSRTYACRANSTNPAVCPGYILKKWSALVRWVNIIGPQTGVLASGDETLCSGGNPSNITFATLPNGGTYQWYYQNGIIAAPLGSSTSGWTIISGATSSSYDPPTGLTQSRTYSCFITGAQGSCGSGSVWASGCRQVTISPAATFGTLTNVNESFCSSGDPSNIIFATVPSGGSGNFTYQWYYQNGLITCPTGSSTSGWTIISGATTASYDAQSGLSQSRTYSCLVTAVAGNGCPASTGWATQCRQVTISPVATFGTLAIANESFCTSGDPSNIVFATTPSGGSNNFTYQWYYQDGLITCPTGSSTSGWTIISGATASSYNAPGGLTQSRTYSCLVTAAAGNGCTVSTGWATQCRQITISPAPTFGIVTDANESFCSSGDPSNIIFATVPSGGSGNFTYQWYYQNGLITCPSGSSTSGWTIISGATSASYDPPSGLTQSRTYGCFVTATAGNGCTASTGWANQCRQVTVGAGAVFGALTNANESICSGGDPSIISFSNIPSGGSGTYTYQWYYQDGLITCPTGSSTAGWTIVNGATAITYDPPIGLVQNRTYTCLVTAQAGGGCIATTGWATNCRQVTITVPPTVTYGTLTTGNESFCTSGDPSNITFATAPSGGTFTYQWYYQDGLITCPTGTSTAGWTIISGATASNYDAPAGLSQSRTYACMVTVTGACVSGNQWATNCRQVTITPAATFGTLTTGNESFCGTGDPSNITFATTPSGGSNTFTYQWYYQDGLITCPTGSSTAGWTIISGATTSSYNPPSGLIASRTYACLVTAAAGNGCTATTNWAAQCRQVTVTPTATFGILALNNETICTGGDPVAIPFATAPNGGSGNYTYQWYYQDGLITCPSGSSTSGWTIISGGTAASYDPPTGLTQNRTYACLVTATAGNGCTATTGWATQCRQVTITTNPIINYGTLTAANESFCNTGDPANITFATTPSGGGGTFTYQWYYQDGLITCPTGTSTAGWTIISGATASNYDAPSGLTQSRTYACFVTLVSACASGSSWATQCRQVTINILPPINYGALATATETFCNTGDPVNIIFSTAPSGGSGIQTYQWYYQDGIITCPSGSSTAGWTVISGATTSSYDPTSITASRTYACLVTDAGNGTCPATSNWATNCRQVTINTVAYGTIANGAETICTNGNPAAITFGTVPTGGGAITYQWYYRNGIQVCPTGTSTFGMVLIAGATSATYDPPAGLNQTRTYACMVNIAAGNGCPAGNSWANNCRIVTVTPLPNYGTLDPNTKRICKGGNPDPLVFQTLPSGGTTYTYQWYYKNGQSLICPSGTNTSGWTLIPGGTAQNYDPPAGLTLTRTYACMVTSSGSGTCSNGTRWATNCVVQTVVPPPTYGTLANGNESVCSGGNPAAISFSTMPGGYGTKTYQWYYKDGVSGSCPTGSSTTGWTSIPGATIQSYDPPSGLTTSRTYACMVTASGTPCAGGQWATNCRKVTIITCREIDYIGFDNDLPEDGKGDADNTSRPQLDGPVLEQNIPNPFTETTSITCLLNKAYNSAVIRVVNVLGEELLLKKLTSPGVNKIEVNRGTLTPGIYFYSLYLDGKLYDTKRMVVTY